MSSHIRPIDVIYIYPVTLIDKIVVIRVRVIGFIVTLINNATVVVVVVAV